MPADPSKDRLLITSASGKQAGKLLPLLSEWQNIRLAVHSSSSKARLQQDYPRAEVIQADLYSPSDCASLLENVTTAIHIGPSYHSHETEIGKMMIDAAVAAYSNGNGVFKHFILSSVLNSQFSKMLNHDYKRVVEEWIMESGIPYTILQPSTFMDNIPVAMLAQQDKPVYPALWSTENRFSMLALSDLAEVFKVVAEEREKHFYAQYPLTSTHQPISFGEALRVVEGKIGKQVMVEKKAFGDAVDALLKRLFKLEDAARADRRSRDTAERMILFYDARGLVGNSNVLEWVLGRDACQFEEFVDQAVSGKGEQSTR
ncbi:unnamed protein product [Alternaria alternata]|jgi:uncharacterized protein YbjT (DUF2867 family)|uniref:NmrA-like domain-containing protein n=1 Tax=Alternaria alternata TaxID=5599 RepID=A0A4Q4NBL5_ALTAL|nr:uncharacterized protein J4E82_010422 [Alternaria postmessia]KAI5368793.1 hypothetical protein J4E82_010422 [Alternaria postmessia]RYN51911.1 hypothetical protein AA0118_g10353 [Alternaria tenuissima]RYN72651.1 hypothetical protein AA0117_g8449 [Alternaria alternata]RYO52291.1 hypothetical protein AA0116_g11074 [Alternaria tenuissima]